MTRARSTSGRAFAALYALPMAPSTAWAHAFGERYDLPVPLGYFVAGAAATVALSFVVAALFMRRAPRASADFVVQFGPLLAIMRPIARVIAVALLCIVIAAGLFGTPNAEENLAPVWVWIIWWVGFAFVTACLGDLWSAIDPWRTLFEWLDAAARRLGSANGVRLGFVYPARLDAWPAVLLLLVFAWLELLYPQASQPTRLASLALAWSVVTLVGMASFGVDAWRRNVDVFAVYFATLGRIAPIGVTTNGRGLKLRAPGSDLVTAPVTSFAMVGFVIAMLATVLFDGLLGTSGMALARRSLAASLAAGDADMETGTIGLICVWLLFLGAYLLACLATARVVHDRTAVSIAKLFVLTLVPIALAYNVAHYFTYLLVYGQLMIPLVSDPLGRGWDLFGTMLFEPDIGIVAAGTTWRLAIASIVIGHIVSIWLAHRIALREFGSRAVIASVPLTVLMVIYTAISLLVMAEPLVRFTEPAGAG